MFIKLLILVLLSVSVLHARSQKSNQFQKNTVDTSVNKFVLLNSISIKQNIGDQTGKLIEDEKATRIQFTNSDRREVLTIYHLDGANANSFNQFEVRKATGIEKSMPSIRDKTFVTESGIRLGMTQQQLIAIKGRGAMNKHKNGVISIQYKVTDKTSDLLKRYNMPIYQAIYYFTSNKLVKFTFGFPNL
jgi:hypothetical protein